MCAQTPVCWLEVGQLATGDYSSCPPALDAHRDTVFVSSLVAIPEYTGNKLRLYLGLISRHHSRTCSKSARTQSCDSHTRAAHINQTVNTFHSPSYQHCIFSWQTHPEYEVEGKHQVFDARFSSRQRGHGGSDGFQNVDKPNSNGGPAADQCGQNEVICRRAGNAACVVLCASVVARPPT